MVRPSCLASSRLLSLSCVLLPCWFTKKNDKCPIEIVTALHVVEGIVHAVSLIWSFMGEIYLREKFKGMLYFLWGDGTVPSSWMKKAGKLIKLPLCWYPGNSILSKPRFSYCSYPAPLVNFLSYTGSWLSTLILSNLSTSLVLWFSHLQVLNLFDYGQGRNDAKHPYPVESIEG